MVATENRALIMGGSHHEYWVFLRDCQSHPARFSSHYRHSGGRGIVDRVEFRRGRPPSLMPAKAQPKRHKITVITIMLPGTIRRYVEQMGEKGWKVIAVGTNLIFLEESPGEIFDAKMVSITLKRPAGIIRLIDEAGEDGWELSAMGSNFLFFNRSNGQTATIGGENCLESISSQVPSQILSRSIELGERGWDLRCVGANQLIFHRATDERRRWAYHFENISLLTPDGMRQLLKERAKASWSLAGTGKLYMAFRQELESK